MSNSQTSDSFQLKVEGTTGITYKIYFDNIDNVTVEELKKKVSERMCIPTHVFQLAFNAKILDERCKLSQYDIFNGCSIKCVETTIGGKFINYKYF